MSHEPPGFGRCWLAGHPDDLIGTGRRRPKEKVWPSARRHMHGIGETAYRKLVVEETGVLIGWRWRWEGIQAGGYDIISEGQRRKVGTYRLQKKNGLSATGV